MQETGDAGLTAEKLLQKKPQTLVPIGKLTVKELFEKLHKITNTTGTGSQEEKINILVNLLQKSSSKGAKYIIRIALGTLRMGAGAMTVTELGDGATLVWRRPSRGLTGVIKPVSAFRDGEGRVCRHLTYSLSLGTFVREVEGTACREQSGAWSLKG